MSGEQVIAARSRAPFVAGDPLRGFAAVGVMLMHFAVFAVLQSSNPGIMGTNYDLGGAYGPLGDALRGVGTGLLLFFVLSGYFLSRPFLRAYVDGTPFPSMPRYARNRLLRIMPAYWAVLTIVLLVWGSLGASTRDVLLAYVLCEPWIGSPLAALIGQAWTLTIELRFYLLMPLFGLLLLAVRRLPRPRLRRRGRLALVLTVVLAVGVASLLDAGTGTVLQPTGNQWLIVYAFVPGIALAALELVAWRRLLAWPRLGVVAWSLLAVLFVLRLSPPLTRTIGDVSGLGQRTVATIQAAGIVGLFLLLQWSGRRVPRWVDNPVTRWVGSRSYAIYLVHWVIGLRLSLVLVAGMGYKDALVVMVATAVPATLIAAELLHRLVEVPFLRLRQRGRPKPPEPSSAAQLVPSAAPAYSADSSHQ